MEARCRGILGIHVEYLVVVLLRRKQLRISSGVFRDSFSEQLQPAAVGFKKRVQLFADLFSKLSRCRVAGNCLLRLLNLLLSLLESPEISSARSARLPIFGESCFGGLLIEGSQRVHSLGRSSRSPVMSQKCLPGCNRMRPLGQKICC